MAHTLKLSILAPLRELYSGEITDLITESSEGKIEILPEHIPTITLIKPTITTFTESSGKKLSAFTSSGVLKTKEDGSVIMLCDACEWPHEIDIKRAEEAKNRAEHRLNLKQSEKDIDVKRAEMALRRALIRLKLTSKI